MNRKVRKLVVPDTVLVMYWNKKAKTYAEMNMQKRGDNEFMVRLKDLTESVVFTVRGEDYTPELPIVVKPPPHLNHFVCDQYRPAYIFYRLDGQASLLAGKRQLFADLPLSVSIGETNKLKVPAGATVALRATADRELKAEPRILPVPGQEGRAAVQAVSELTQDEDGKNTRFTVRLDNVRTKQEFLIEFSDLENIAGRRRVEIDAAADEKPTVEVEVEPYIREVKEGSEYKEYKSDRVVTVSGWIPFVGKVRDDHGLAGLDVVYSLTPLETRTARSSDLVTAGTIVGQLVTGPGAHLRALPQLVAARTIGNGTLPVWDATPGAGHPQARGAHQRDHVRRLQLRRATAGLGR
jgi:hypothetical protein